MSFPGKRVEKPDEGTDNSSRNHEVLPAGYSRKTRYHRQLFKTRKTTEDPEINLHLASSSPISIKTFEPITAKQNPSIENPGPSRSSSKSRSGLDLWEDCEDPEELLEEYILFKNLLLKMINLAREFAIFCFVLVVYAAITKDPPKVSKEPPAYPFFPKDSPVKDWYRGEISKAIEKAHMSDMTMVMFYAPWDAQSQEARTHFEVAAGYLKEEVYFTAVNCWQPFSECRRQYNKVYRWPVFIAYPSHGRGVQYSGPITAAHLISFAQKVIKPLKRIHSLEQPLDFREAFLIVELNCRPGSLEYGIYYVAALRYLERESLRPVTFYVKSVTQSKLKMSLYLWHQVRIKDFDTIADFTVENILFWINNEMDQATTWVAPTGAKSLSLFDRIKKKPALLMFTPYNPLTEQNDYYNMLQEVAYEYKNCDDWGLNFDISAKRQNNFREFKHLKSTCKPTKPKVETNPKIVSVVHSAVWANVSSIKNKVAKGKLEDTDCNVPYKSTIADMCQNFKIEKFGGLQSDVLYEMICENIKRDFVEPYKTSMLRASDAYAMGNLAKVIEKQKCRQFLTAEKLQPSFFEQKLENSKYNSAPDRTSSLEFQGLACKTNKSLSFVAMDSLLNFHFAEKLGIDLSKENDRSAVVIIDEKLESHYILRKPITVQSLKKFVIAYTQNHLKRSTESRTSVETKNTHFYSVDKDRSRLNDSRIFYVEEVFGWNFLETVLQKDKAFLVLYYSKHCAYCSGVSYMFLTISRKLALVENLRFIRIDGDLNILSWEYTMEKFPTLLYFPLNKKSETRVYPADLPLKVSNLLGFLLNNLDAPLKIQAIYSLCLQSQFRQEKTQCLLNLRNDTLTLINDTLRLWRKSNTRQKQVILHNLKQLRNLQLLFGHSSNNVDLIQHTFRKFRSQELQDYKVKNQSREQVKDEL